MLSVEQILIEVRFRQPHLDWTESQECFWQQAISHIRKPNIDHICSSDQPQFDAYLERDRVDSLRYERQMVIPPRKHALRKDHYRIHCSFLTQYCNYVSFLELGPVVQNGLDMLSRTNSLAKALRQRILPSPKHKRNRILLARHSNSNYAHQGQHCILCVDCSHCYDNILQKCVQLPVEN